MNERLKKLAEQAGFDFDDYYDSVTQEELERFVELVRDDEREACAKLVEGYHPDSFFMGQVQDAANLIRARGDK